MIRVRFEVVERRGVQHGERGPPRQEAGAAVNEQSRSFVYRQDSRGTCSGMARFRWSLLLALWLSSAVQPAAAQVGSATDIITGKVTGPDGEPIADATVEAISTETEVSRQRTT